jgi:hypothetical protein
MWNLFQTTPFTTTYKTCMICLSNMKKRGLPSKLGFNLKSKFKDKLEFTNHHSRINVCIYLS